MVRTDLAVEAHELSQREAVKIDGVRVTKTEHGHITKNVVDILDENGAEALGKKKGRYITIEAPDLKHSLDDYETVCKMLSEELRALAGESRLTLVAGLGNRDITPDALGQEVVSQIIVTKHMKEKMPGVLPENYGDVCAVSPGVMGTTGIETVDIIKGVADMIKPDLIIAVDALAGADMNRVCSTVQIADTGIQPGAGVGNNRAGLNEETLGVKVIAVGVPTVIAAEVLTGESGSDEPLMVTTKDIDLVIRRMSKTVANGINMALHRDLTFRDIESVIS